MFTKHIWTIIFFSCSISLLVDASSSSSSLSGQQYVSDLRAKVSQAGNRLRNQLIDFYNTMSTYSIGHDHTTHSSIEKQGCGLTIDDQTNFLSIRSGSDAFAYDWPWMVALFKESAHGWHCGAVLINSNTILTAAHCVENMTAEEIKPVLGAHTLVENLNLLNYRTVKSIHRHPKYKNCCQDDVAILKLTKPVVYGPKINRVCLPFPASSFSKITNKTVTVIGWGKTEKKLNRSANVAQKLQEGKIKLFDDLRCEKDHGELFDSKTQFCAGDYQNQTDTMGGDSGGPLIMRNSNFGERWTVLGLTSYKSKNTTKATGVYVKLTAFEEFIKSHLK